MKFTKPLIFLSLAAILFVGGVFTATSLTERVDAGTYKIIQELDGDLKVLDTPGWHWTGFVSNITKYNVAGIYQFSDNDRDEGDNAIGVIFRDGTKGYVNGNLQFLLPTDNKQRLNLHTIYGRSYEQVINNLIIKSTSEVVKATSPFFKGEGAYSYDKANFINMVESQLEKGLFTQVKQEIVVKDADGKDNVEVLVSTKKDSNGNPIISKESKFKAFGVQILGLNIEDIKLDEKAMMFIEKKKETELEALVAKQKAETAKQAAATAKEEARKMVELAKGQEEVNKMKAVVEAQKNKEVAELKAQQELNVAKLNRQTQEENANALLIQGKAEAETARLKVQAGITPLEKAQIERDTAIGVARELAQINVPQIVITGGGKTGNVSPLDFIGVNQALEIQKKLNSNNNVINFSTTSDNNNN